MIVIRDIAQQVKAKKQITAQDKIAFMRQDPEAMAAFMIANNPGSVNATLRAMGYDKLAFAPNTSVLAQQLQTFINTGNWSDLNTVISKFILKEDGLNPDFVNLYKQTFKI
jgi:hypothetical protein